MVSIAVGQITSTACRQHNLALCRRLIGQAARRGAKALFLPEASDYLASSPAEAVALAQPANTSEFVCGLREEARLAGIAIQVGIHEPATEGTETSNDTHRKIKNTVIWIDETGQILHRYQKIHLFDVHIPKGPTLCESETVEAGTRILEPFPTSIGTVGMAICFDLRFPELAHALRRQGAHILTFPAAFTVPTGQAQHWEVLLRARAIETQSYVIAAAQVGWHNAKRQSWGQSMVVDPWGRIIARLPSADDDPSNTASIAMADIDLEYLAQVRRNMPLLHRLT